MSLLDRSHAVLGIISVGTWSLDSAFAGLTLSHRLSPRLDFSIGSTPFIGLFPNSSLKSIFKTMKVVIHGLLSNNSNFNMDTLEQKEP